MTFTKHNQKKYRSKNKRYNNIMNNYIVKKTSVITEVIAEIETTAIERDDPTTGGKSFIITTHHPYEYNRRWVKNTNWSNNKSETIG